MDMTNPEYRHLILIIDRSGSMQSCREATQEGISGFFAAQAGEPGRATASLFEFDTEHDTVFEHVALADAPPYTLVPRNGTALLDAVGFAFAREGEWLASLPEDDRPGAVVVVIATDGDENSSREYTPGQIRDIIREQQDTYGWQVLFIGANMDAVKTAASYGVPVASAMTFNTASTAGAYASVSNMVSRGASGLGYQFTDQERATATGLGES
jgi:Mg-chelatase subunit ChlD